MSRSASASWWNDWYQNSRCASTARIRLPMPGSGGGVGGGRAGRVLVRLAEPAKVGDNDVEAGQQGDHPAVVAAVPWPAVQENGRRPAACLVAGSVTGPVVGKPEAIRRSAHRHSRSLAPGFRRGVDGILPSRPPPGPCPSLAV